ncbi:MAG: hypothetical protein ABW252_08190 [Polyangiales bacterium]
MPKTATWVSHDDQRCTHCLQPYSYVAVRHCHLCDGPSCPHCVTVVEATTDVVCVRCAAMPDDEEM